jgi:RNA polymerase sigma-54 factor
MELKQTLRLSQQLVMTPQLQQAIRLLQLSRLELIDEVRKELDGNPILSDDEHGGAAAAAEAKNNEVALGNSEFTKSNETRESEKAAREVDWEKFL